MANVAATIRNVVIERGDDDARAAAIGNLKRASIYFDNGGTVITAGADTILFLRELPNGTVKGSMRSTKKNVAEVAQLLGGGGHIRAAGFTIPGRIEETEMGPRVVNP